MFKTIVIAVVLVVAAFPLSQIGKSSTPSSMGANDESDNRIQPVARVQLQTAAAAPTDGKPKDGATVYNTVCAACHGTGAAGAPKTGDKAAWGPRIATGKEALYKSALTGKNAMPARGGSSLSDGEIKAAVDHLIGQSK
jgi:cytochrome c5